MFTKSLKNNYEILYEIVHISIIFCILYIHCKMHLQALRSGVYDVLPSSSFEGLTAEDFRLLLNGVGEINVQTLISYTSFNDESGKLICQFHIIFIYYFIIIRDRK